MREGDFDLLLVEIYGKSGKYAARRVGSPHLRISDLPSEPTGKKEIVEVELLP